MSCFLNQDELPTNTEVPGNDDPEDEQEDNMPNFWDNSDSDDASSEEDNVVDDPLELPANSEDLNYANYDPNFMKDESNIDNNVFLESGGSIESTTVFEFLPEEEVTIIKKCTDPDLQKLLILNRTKKIRLKVLISKYHKLLSESKSKLFFENNKLNRLSKTINKYKLKPFAYPYFRDKDNYYPPLNADAIKKSENMEINCNYLSKKVWNVFTQQKLKALVGLQIYNNKAQCIESQICSPSKNEDEEEISALKDKLMSISYSKDDIDYPPLGDDSIINWENVSIALFKDPSYAKACRGCWNLYLHPDIYKGAFSKSENDKILYLAEKHNYQNWESILPELEKNRSAYAVCVHYFTNLQKTVNYEPFSLEEDNLLLQLVESAQVGAHIPWSNIKYHFDTRTKAQIYYRYRQMMEEGFKKKGQFTINEDVLIQCLVKKHGANFEKISYEMTNRTKDQIKRRYNTHLKPSSTTELGNWTAEEDLHIINHVKVHGPKNWKLLEQHVARNVGHIRHRYRTINKHLTRNPGLEIQDIPRRTWIPAPNRMSKEKSNQMAQTFILTKTLPSLEPRIPERRLKGRHPRGSIDEDLVNFFRSTARVRKAPVLRAVFEHNISDCADTINHFFHLLGINLTIPSEEEIKEKDYPLESYDMEILRKLRHKKNSITFNSSTQEINTEGTNSLVTKFDIPPNVNTIQALRCLILKYHSFHPKNVELENLTSEIGNDLEAFEQRFNAMFRWPSLMSLVDPPEKLFAKPEIVKKVYGKGKRGRPSKDLTKVKKMNEARRSKPVMNNTIQDSSTDLSIIDLPSTSGTQKQHIILNNIDLEELKRNNEFSYKSASVVNSTNIESIEDVARTIARLPPKKNHKYVIKVGKSTVQSLLKRKVIDCEDAAGEEILNNIKLDISDELPGPSNIKKHKK